MAANGGKRPGAGRPKGLPNKKRRITEEIANKFLASGKMTPLEVMLEVMEHGLKTQDISLAMSAANSAAPYVHARLAATTISGDPNAPLAVSIIDDVD